MTVEKFNKIKRYVDFQELMKDFPCTYPEVKSGIVIVFEDNGEMSVMPICTQSQCAFAAADLLKKAAE